MIQTLIIMPILGILANQIFCKTSKETYQVGLTASILTFFESLIIASEYDWESGQFYTVSNLIGIDGISLVQIILTTFLIPITLLSTWKTIQVQIKSVVNQILLIELLTQGVFMSLDLLQFYICFESVLIPLFIQIGIYGGRERKIQAAYSLFIYTIFGSQVMFLAIQVIYFEYGSLNYTYLSNLPISENRQFLQWWPFFISFAVKIPMVPAHIWLPEAHVEAPTAGSVLLAGIIQKLGGYGQLRYSQVLFPDACAYFKPFVFTQGLIGIQYSSIACLAQIDIKKVIAYSSIGHMNASVQGLFTNSVAGISGSVFFMISHGLISSALFQLIGVLYDRYHTRTIFYYRGIALFMPLFTLQFLIFSLANIAFPGTSSFIAEFLTYLGCLEINPFLAILATTAIIQTPCYALWFYHQIVYGRHSNFIPHIANDLTLKEFNVLLPLLVFTFVQGQFPNPQLNVIVYSVQPLIY